MGQVAGRWTMTVSVEVDAATSWGALASEFNDTVERIRDCQGRSVRPAGEVWHQQVHNKGREASPVSSQAVASPALADASRLATAMNEMSLLFRRKWRAAPQ